MYLSIMTSTKKHLIYIIESPSGKFYIGRTCNFVSRMHRHARMGDDCRKLNNAIEKYGWNNFEVSVLQDDLSFEDAVERETFFIELLDTIKYGYNILKGGVGLGSGKDCVNFGRIHTEEHRRNNSKAKTGNLNPNYGKPRSDITKKKISQGQKRIPVLCIYNFTGMGIVFESLVDASEFSGVHTGRISTIMRNKIEKIRGGSVSVIRKQASGFSFFKIK